MARQSVRGAAVADEVEKRGAVDAAQRRSKDSSWASLRMDQRFGLGGGGRKLMEAQRGNSDSTAKSNLVRKPRQHSMIGPPDCRLPCRPGFLQNSAYEGTAHGRERFILLGSVAAVVLALWGPGGLGDRRACRRLPTHRQTQHADPPSTSSLRSLPPQEDVVPARSSRQSSPSSSLPPSAPSSLFSPACIHRTPSTVLRQVWKSLH